MKKIFTLAAAACISAGMFAAETVYDLTPASWDPANGETVDVSYGLYFSASLGTGIKPIAGAHGTLTCDAVGYAQDVNIVEIPLGAGFTALLVSVDVDPSADGTYILDMPQGQWGDADFLAGNGGHANAAFTYTYEFTGLGGGTTTSCEITGYTPANGSTISQFGTGDYLVIDTTDNSAVDYFEIYWWDVTNGEDEDHREYVRQSYGNHNYSPDPITWEGTITPIEFVAGHRYRADVTLYSQAWQGPTTPIAAQGSVYYEGGTAAYVYSPVRLLNIEPNPETYIIEKTDFTTTLVFDGWMEVNIDESGIGAGQGTEFGTLSGCFTYNDEHTEVSVKWPDSYLSSCGPQARMVLALYDKDGLIYDNGEGVKGASRIELIYQCETSGCELFVTPEPGEVTELTSFACSIGSKYGGEMNISFTSPNATLVRMDMVNGDEVVYEFGYPDVTKTTGSGQTTMNVEFTFTLPEPITAPGRYALEIPYGYFNAGNQFTEARTLRYVGIYTIEGTVTPGEITYDVLPVLENCYMTSDWEGLKLMIDWSCDYVGSNYEVIEDCYITDAAGNNVQNITGACFDWDSTSIYGLILDPSLYADGEQYTAHVVKGAFGDSEFTEVSNFTSGHACPALEVLFTTENVLAYNIAGEEPKDEVIYDITDPSIEAGVADGVATINYTFADDLSLNISREHYQYPKLISGYTLTADGEAAEADVVVRAVNNRLVLTIEPVSIESEATYVLTLDKGLFGDDEWFASDYKAGHANDVIEFSFVPSAFRPALEYVTPEILIEKRNATADGSIEETGDPAIVVTLRFAFDIWWPEGFNFFNVCKLYGPDDNLVNITDTHQFYGSTSDYTIYKFEMWGFDMDSDQTYTLNVPAAIYGNTEWLNSNGRWGMCNEELNIQFIPGNYQNAGVEGVAVDAVANDVYNMQGALILRDATAAQVKALPAGLYIVGGRKVAVK